MAVGVQIQLLNPKKAAESLGVCARTLWSLTAPRGPIPCLRVGDGGRSIRYDARDLLAFIEDAKAKAAERAKGSQARDGAKAAA